MLVDKKNPLTAIQNNLEETVISDQMI